MDHDDSIEIPGGTNYKDVTALFEQAGEGNPTLHRPSSWIDSFARHAAWCPGI